jgi:hypothetical protein
VCVCVCVERARCERWQFVVLRSFYREEEVAALRRSTEAVLTRLGAERQGEQGSADMFYGDVAFAPIEGPADEGNPHRVGYPPPRACADSDRCPRAAAQLPDRAARAGYRRVASGDGSQGTGPDLDGRGLRLAPGTSAASAEPRADLPSRAPSIEHSRRAAAAPRRTWRTTAAPETATARPRPTIVRALSLRGLYRVVYVMERVSPLGVT